MLLKDFFGIGAHVAVELAFGCDLIDAVDVVVDLVGHELFDDLDASDLCE